MEEGQEGCGRADGGGLSVKWIFGIAACLIGSSCNSMGFVLQKWAHTANKELVESGRRPWPHLGGLLFSPLWMVGFAISIILGTPFDVFALSVLPSSVNAPMSGITIIMGQVLAPCILKEPITRLDWVATLLITAGIVLTATFGSHCSTMYSVEDILKLCGNTLFQAFEVSALLLLLLAFIFIRYLIPWLTQDPRHTNRLKGVSYSLVAGFVGAQSNLLVKACAEFAERLAEGDSSDWRTSFWPYAFAGGALMGAFTQLSYLNLGMKYWTVVKALPIFFSSLIIFQATYGGVFYQDYKHMTLAGFIVFPIALVIQICGITMLCLRDSPESNVSETFLDSSKVDDLTTESNVSDISLNSCNVDDLTNAAKSPQQQPPSKCETLNVSLPFTNEEMVVSGDSFENRVFWRRDQVGLCNDKIEVAKADAASGSKPLHCENLRAVVPAGGPGPLVIHEFSLGA